MATRFQHPLIVAVCSLILSTGASAWAEGSVKLIEAKGSVLVRAPKAEDYTKVATGAVIATGSRLKTAEGAEATLQFPSGTKTRVRGGSELIVRLSGSDGERAGIGLFFGRVWSKVVKMTGGGDQFEVRSANAAAGVRGTEFEVGVALDGSTRVLVGEGAVAVSAEDDSKHKRVEPGQMIEASGEGRLGGIGKTPKDPDWNGWFSQKAKEMEKRGLKVAKSLNHRLNKRKSKLERLVRQQKKLRQDIQRLEQRAKKGAEVKRQLQKKLDELTRVTERLESMQQRLQGAFALFDRWKGEAQRGSLSDGDAIGKLAIDVDKIAADFADMIEEGTDQSVEGMEEMMDDMKDGKGLEPGDSAADELFR